MVEGDKMVRELLQQQPERILELYALDTWLSEVKEAAHLHPAKAIAVSEAELKKISNLKAPNQVLAVVEINREEAGPQKVEASLNLYLDGIQDPGNFGTILRIADWFGIPYLFCSSTCVDPYNPKVVQASMGAFLRVACIEKPLAEIHAAHPELPVYGAVMDGENVFRAPLDSSRGIIVIGNEGSGIAPATQGLLSRRISIPPAAHSGAESLNAAVAAGILCAAFRERGG